MGRKGINGNRCQQGFQKETCPEQNLTGEKILNEQRPSTRSKHSMRLGKTCHTQESSAVKA